MQNPGEFAAVADRLCAVAEKGECPSEAAYRAAIGRYYYAALLTARSYLRAIGKEVSQGEGSHAAIIQGLERLNKPLPLKVANSLKTLRRERNTAEYGDPLERPKSAASDAQCVCQGALRDLEKLVAGIQAAKDS